MVKKYIVYEGLKSPKTASIILRTWKSGFAEIRIQSP